MKNSELVKLRSEIEVARSRKPLRYPAAVRKRGVRYSDRRLKEGAGLAQVAAELGLKPHTLNYWRGKRGGLPAKRPRLQPVTVRPDAAAMGKTFVVRGPGGLTIEGLELSVQPLVARVRSGYRGQHGEVDSREGWRSA